MHLLSPFIHQFNLNDINFIWQSSSSQFPICILSVTSVEWLHHCSPFSPPLFGSFFSSDRKNHIDRQPCDTMSRMGPIHPHCVSHRRPPIKSIDYVVTGLQIPVNIYDYFVWQFLKCNSDSLYILRPNSSWEVMLMCWWNFIHSPCSSIIRLPFYGEYHSSAYSDSLIRLVTVGPELVWGSGKGENMREEGTPPGHVPEIEF